MAAERVVLNPDGQPTAKAAVQAGGVKAMQHEQSAFVREEQRMRWLEAVGASIVCGTKSFA
eukprot:1938056-Heterocapsa_arctica.AAC.1